MCLHEDCKFIEIIEIDDVGTKVYIHLDSNYRPILIQYWSARVGECLDFK